MLREKVCENCEEFIAMGSGDYVCGADYNFVYDNYTPNDHYMWCGGEKFTLNLLLLEEEGEC